MQLHKLSSYESDSQFYIVSTNYTMYVLLLFILKSLRFNWKAI